MLKGAFMRTVMLFCAQAVIILRKAQITSLTQSMTIPYTTTFSVLPYISFYIQSGRITSPQFSVTSNQTSLSYSRMNITFVTYVSANQFNNGGYIYVGILISDKKDNTMNLGVVALNISASSLTFTGFLLNYTNSKFEVYSLAFPMSYIKIQNSTTLANNQIVLRMDNVPSTYMVQGKIFFSYIYFTNTYTANGIMALYQGFSESTNSYQFSYNSFAFKPNYNEMMIATKSYISISNPFFYISTFSDLTTSGTDIDSFKIGFTISQDGIYYNADAFIFSNSFQGCPVGNFLYYLTFFSTLPYSCQACSSTCQTCFAANISHPNITDSNSCLSCPPPFRYLNITNSYNMRYGSCPCLRGMEQKDGVCIQCSMDCLTFKVVYIQTTNQSNFLLYFSLPSIIEKIPIDQNLMVKINGGKALNFSFIQTNDAVYTISLSLDEMLPCEMAACSINFRYINAQSIFSSDQIKVLANSNYTVQVKNFINYYNQLPSKLQETFEVMGMVMIGTYTSGYTSLFKILFQLEQLIDAHKYLNLTLPIIYNQLVEQTQNFKFMDLTYLLPSQMRAKLTSFIPTDLDQFGPPRLIYYEQGVNYAKNIITGIISLAFMLLVNYTIYLIFCLLPFKLTRILAKKMAKRKLITINDSFEQLVFPIFFYSITNFQYFLLHPYLYWIYAFAAICCLLSISAPFFVVIYVYINRKNEKKVELFQDLLQDNKMSQPVTYVYYILNYYRKVFFALCLTNILPGLVQIYLLICLNSVHLAFQLYLIVAKTYKSRSKVIVRLINSVCIIAVQILIMIYNLILNDKQTMINIGLSCFYLSITTALLNIIDSFIKLLDTIFQQINHRKVAAAEIEMFKQNPVLKQFSKQIICNLGQELKPANQVRDPKQIKFQQDKELMEQTFNKGDEEQDISDQVSQAVKSQAEEIQLVFIDQDWTNVYPAETHPNFAVEQEKRKNARKLSVKMPEEYQNDLYEIPQEINIEVDKISKEKEMKKHSKPQNINKAPTRAKNKTLHIKPIRQTKLQDQEISEIS